MVQDLDAAYGVVPGNDFYVTGVYTTDGDGDPAIETGALAITAEAEVALTEEYQSEIRLAQETHGFTLRRFRLVDEGPVLDLLNGTKNGSVS